MKKITDCVNVRDRQIVLQKQEIADEDHIIEDMKIKLDNLTRKVSELHENKESPKNGSKSSNQRTHPTIKKKTNLNPLDISKNQGNERYAKYYVMKF